MLKNKRNLKIYASVAFLIFSILITSIFWVKFIRFEKDNEKNISDNEKHSDYFAVGEKYVSTISSFDKSITTEKNAISSSNASVIDDEKFFNNISNICIVNKPDSKYYLGDKISNDDIVVKGKGPNGKWKEIPHYLLDFKNPSDEDMLSVGEKNIIVKYKYDNTVATEYYIKVFKPTIKVEYDGEKRYIAKTKPKCDVEWYFFGNENCFEINENEATVVNECKTLILASVKYNGYRYFSDPVSYEIEPKGLLSLKETPKKIGNSIQFKFMITERNKYSNKKFMIYWFNSNSEKMLDENNLKEYINRLDFLKSTCNMDTMGYQGLLVILVKDKNEYMDYYYDTFNNNDLM